MSAPQFGEKQKTRGANFSLQPTVTRLTVPDMAYPFPVYNVSLVYKALFSIHAPRPRLKWYGFHDGLEPAEGFPDVVEAANAREIFGTNPKSV